MPGFYIISCNGSFLQSSVLATRQECRGTPFSPQVVRAGSYCIDDYLSILLVRRRGVSQEALACRVCHPKPGDPRRGEDLDAGAEIRDPKSQAIFFRLFLKLRDLKRDEISQRS